MLPPCVLYCLLSKYACVEKKQILSSLLLHTKIRKEVEYKQGIAEDKINLAIISRTKNLLHQVLTFFFFLLVANTLLQIQFCCRVTKGVS